MSNSAGGASHDIPKERDRVTGEAGDLGAWPEDVEFNPAEVWDGTPAIFSYVTHSTLGQHFEEGDEMAVVFKDRTLVCDVKEVHQGEEDE